MISQLQNALNALTWPAAVTICVVLICESYLAKKVFFDE